jgi:predicted nucleotidyltransferase
MKVIQEHIKELRELCKKHFVSEIYVFGSVLTKDFNSDSDIDFLVRFYGVDPKDYFDNYMDLKESLELLFSRSIDLVEIQTLKNPILKRSIERSKTILYGRKDSKMAV